MYGIRSFFTEHLFFPGISELTDGSGDTEIISYFDFSFLYFA
jgi:hypothetical protein